MSNTKHSIIVGSYTPAEQPGIHFYSFDTGSGELAYRKGYTGISNPSFLARHPNGQWLYAVSETCISDGEYGGVHALRIVPGDDGELEPINSRSTEGDWPCHLAIDATGSWLVATNYGTGNAAVYPIQRDGSLGEMRQFLQHEGAGPNQARQEGPHAHSATFTPDNRYVILADLGIDRLMIYRFDPETGALDHHAETATRPGAGPRHLAFHPQGRHVVVANELDSSVTVYSYDAALGTLAAEQTLPTVLEADPGNTVADIHFSPDGAYLYVTNRGYNSVAVFAFEPDGRLNSLGFPSCGGNWPRNFAVVPGGNYLLVANRRSNEISVLPLAAGGAEVGAALHSAPVNEPSCILFM